jgi:hypothetical protein
MSLFSTQRSPARTAIMLKRKQCRPTPVCFSMNVSPAEPYSNQNKGIAACFALTVQSNARQSSSINPVAPDRIFRKFLNIHGFEQVMI